MVHLGNNFKILRIIIMKYISFIFLLFTQTVIGQSFSSRVNTVVSGTYAPLVSPSFTTPSLGVATATSINGTSIPQTTISGNAATATAWATGRTLSITGDLSYTSPTIDGTGNVTGTGTLATVNSNVGTFTNATITVNAKGLVTAASSGSSSGQTFAQVSALMVIRY